jgi:hypothetical protein
VGVAVGDGVGVLVRVGNGVGLEVEEAAGVGVAVGEGDAVSVVDGGTSKAGTIGTAVSVTVAKLVGVTTAVGAVPILTRSTTHDVTATRTKRARAASPSLNRRPIASLAVPNHGSSAVESGERGDWV